MFQVWIKFQDLIARQNLAGKSNILIKHFKFLINSNLWIFDLSIFFKCQRYSVDEG